MTDEEGGYDVGYGKPPKRNRFAPGKSGNPAGRPRKSAPAKRPADPRLDATRRALVERAERPVTVLEHGKRKKVTTIEAVHGALVNTALKGGVLAQRTLLELYAKEDTLYRSERQERFTYWRNYRIEAQVKLDLAEKHEEPAPNLVPHPDDIHLEYATLTVRFDGPIDEEDAAEKAKLRRHALLSLELSAYWQETFEFNADNPGKSKVGPFLATWMTFSQLLPPRMRKQTPQEYEAQRQRMISRRPGGLWETYLEAECAEFGMPMIRPNGPIRFVELKDFCEPDHIREIAERQLRSAMTKELDDALAAAAREQRQAEVRSDRRKRRTQRGAGKKSRSEEPASKVDAKV